VVVRLDDLNETERPASAKTPFSSPHINSIHRTAFSGHKTLVSSDRSTPAAYSTQPQIHSAWRFLLLFSNRQRLTAELGSENLMSRSNSLRLWTARVVLRGASATSDIYRRLSGAGSSDVFSRGRRRMERTLRDEIWLTLFFFEVRDLHDFCGTTGTTQVSMGAAITNPGRRRTGGFTVVVKVAVLRGLPIAASCRRGISSFSPTTDALRFDRGRC
jgi:hypothetical protein